MKPKLTSRPSGILCACGCGEETIIYRGALRKFIFGHHSRGPTNPHWNGGRQKAGKYINLWLPDHPRANKRGQIKEHIVVAEPMLQRSLNYNEIVHHIDHNGHNNAPENLLVMDRGEHTKLHLTGTTFPRYTDAELLGHLAALLPISFTEYRKRFKYPSHETYRYRFGSWTTAKQLASKVAITLL